MKTSRHWLPHFRLPLSDQDLLRPYPIRPDAPSGQGAPATIARARAISYRLRIEARRRNSQRRRSHSRATGVGHSQFLDACSFPEAKVSTNETTPLVASFIAQSTCSKKSNG